MGFCVHIARTFEMIYVQNLKPLVGFNATPVSTHTAHHIFCGSVLTDGA